eukprot:COSAG02_NODE_378_length_23535_cov_35.310164_7_plen_383_part_00
MRPGAGVPAVPSPALAVCSAHNAAACCDMDGELSFTLAVAQSQYAATPACYSAMLDVHCGAECHAKQDVFTVGTDVKICESYCVTLHGLCASADDVAPAVEACTAIDSTDDGLCGGVVLGQGSSASDCTSVGDGSRCTYQAEVTQVDASGMAADAWCEGLTIFPWVAANGGSFTTAVVPDADNVGTCWGGPAADDCAGVPNGGQAFDSCGVCGGDGTSCTVPGAATVDALSTSLTGSLSAHVAAEEAAQAALGTWATTQAARLLTEQTRAATEHAAKLDATRNARAALVTDMASKDDTITTHTAEVTASLTTARDASTASMADLAAKVGDSTAAINADYARVATAHAAQAAVSEAVLAREMASWQATHDTVTAEINRLKAAN